MNEEQRSRLKEALKKYLRKCMQEMSTTGTGAHFNTGPGEQYATPNAFAKGGKENKGTKEAEKEGWKKVSPKQRFQSKTFDIEKWH